MPGLLARILAESTALAAADAPTAAYALSVEYERLRRKVDAPVRDARAAERTADLFDVRRCAAEEVACQRDEFAADADGYAARGDAFKTWYAARLHALKTDERADILSPTSTTALSPLAYRVPTPPDGPANRKVRGDDDPDHFWRPRAALFDA